MIFEVILPKSVPLKQEIQFHEKQFQYVQRNKIIVLDRLKESLLNLLEEFYT